MIKQVLAFLGGPRPQRLPLDLQGLADEASFRLVTYGLNLFGRAMLADRLPVAGNRLGWLARLPIGRCAQSPNGHTLWEDYFAGIVGHGDVVLLEGALHEPDGR